jgi:hypothetical protein
MFGRALLLAVSAAAMLVAVTGALAASRMSAPPPALSSLVLAPADFRSGGAVGSQSTATTGGLPLFERVFKSGVIGATPLLGAVSLAILETDASSALSDFKQFDAEAQSPAGRQAIAKVWAAAFVKGANVGSHGKVALTVKQMVVGAPVEVGSTALRLPLTVKTNLGTMRLAFEVAQTDRALAIIMLMGRLNARIGPADAAEALLAAQRHLQAAFAIANTTAPTISGTQTQGQVISVDEGTWTGAPSAFSYSWSRCDASGANCAPIADATANSYAVTAADSGSTLRVTVAGANSVSSQQGVSNPTAVIA